MWRKLLVLFAVMSLVSFSVVDGMSDQSKSPIKIITIAVQADMRPKFFEEMEKFANKYKFQYQMDKISPDDEFSIDIWRNDLWISAVNVENHSEFVIGLYDGDAKPSIELINGVLSELHRISNSIPNSTFKE